MRISENLIGKKLRILLLLIVVGITTGITSFAQVEVRVMNNLSIDREEVVSVPLIKLKKIWTSGSRRNLIVRESKSGDHVVSQVIESSGELIFLVKVKAKAESAFVIVTGDGKTKVAYTISTYSRFVPDRTDDYAWENDKVAFRTYGPEAQRMIEQNIKGGTLTSGLDCWLKRVDYPIIDKWYKKYVDGGSYHKDSGEGYDPYHVGASRGCGGIGIWKNDSLYVSKNFISYKKIAEGPVRNIFELTYAPWKVDNITIRETKRITIDLGSQLYQVKEILESSEPIPNCTIGITLHDKKGITTADNSKGFFSYWEKIDDAELGTGVVIDKKYFIESKDFRTTKKDLSHLYVISKPVSNSVEYYTGFGWSKTGIITTKEQWNNYLRDFAEQMSSPLLVTIK